MSPDAGVDAGPDGRVADLGRDLGPADAAPDHDGADGGEAGCPTPGWTTPTSPTAENLEAVWGSASNDVFAVGAKSTVLHWDGTAWTKMTGIPVQADLHAVHGSASNRVFAAGQDGVVLQYDGAKWSTFNPTGATEALRGVWATATQVWTVGDAGAIYQHDGTQWIKHGGPAMRSWRAITAMQSTPIAFLLISSKAVYMWGPNSPAVGVWENANNNEYFRGGWGHCMVGQTLNDGRSWSYRSYNTVTHLISFDAQPAGTFPLNAIWGSGSCGSDMFAVGEGGSVQYHNGDRWHDLSADAGTTHNLNGVWRSGDNRAFIVGDLGTILHHRGGWRPIEKQTTDQLNAIDGTSANDIVVAGGGGLVMRYQNGAWTSERLGTDPIYDVWLGPSGQTYAVQNAPPATGHVQKFDGRNWAPTHTAPGLLFGVWGAPTGEVVAAGVNLIEHYENDEWASHAASGAQYGADGTSASDIYTVGQNGAIYHYDGMVWSKDATSPTSQDLVELWAVSSTDVFVVGNQGVVLRGEKGSWSIVGTPGGDNQHLRAVWGSSPTSVFVGGVRGMIYRYDGSNLRVVVSGTGANIEGIWGSGPENVYAVGSNGTMLHWCGP